MYTNLGILDMKKQIKAQQGSIIKSMATKK